MPPRLSLERRESSTSFGKGGKKKGARAAGKDKYSRATNSTKAKKKTSNFSCRLKKGQERNNNQLYYRVTGKKKDMAES